MGLITHQPGDRRLLLLSPNYTDFVKGPSEATAKYVKKITIIIRYNVLVDLLRYIPLGGIFDSIRAWYTKEKLLDLQGKPENIDIHLLPILYYVRDGKNNSLGDKIAKKAEKLIQKEEIKFDLIHAHFTYPQGYVGIKLGEEFDVPVVITAHGFDVYDLPFRDREWEKKIKWILNKTNHVITVSKSNKKILVEKLGVSENKLSVIPNGFNSNLFYPMDNTEFKWKLNIPLDKKIILNVASLNQVKGQRYLIDAMKEIVKYRKDILCIIIGDGMLRKDLKSQVKKLGLKNYIKLTGSKPHDEIPLWMNAADLFVLPSLSEGNPTVMFEALGTGLPFIGTRVGGVPEIITSEDYGLLCECANSKDLADKILIGLDKEWDRENILEYAKQFTWENIAKEIIGIYKLLI